MLKRGIIKKVMKMNKRMKSLVKGNLWTLLGVIIFIIASSILSFYNLSECATVKYFHLYCPGCGGTRALFALLRLDFIEMIRYNLNLPLAIFTYMYYNIRAFIEIKKNNEQYFERLRYRLLIIVGCIALIYSIARNALLLYGIDLIGDILK